MHAIHVQQYGQWNTKVNPTPPTHVVHIMQVTLRAIYNVSITCMQYMYNSMDNETPKWTLPHPPM